MVSASISVGCCSPFLIAASAFVAINLYLLFVPRCCGWLFRATAKNCNPLPPGLFGARLIGFF